MNVIVSIPTITVGTGLMSGGVSLGVPVVKEYAEATYTDDGDGNVTIGRPAVDDGGNITITR